MNLLITLAVTALVGGSALFVSTVAPESVRTESDAQAHVSTDVSASTETDETSTHIEEDGRTSFGSKVKSFLHLDVSEEGAVKEDSTTEVKAEADVDVSGDAETGTGTKAEGSGLIEVAL